MHKFSQHVLVYEDIEEIVAYVAREGSTRLAKRVAHRINETLDALERFPALYSGRAHPFAEVPNLRTSIVKFHHSYLIFFTADGKERRILYIHHSSRKNIESRHQSEKRI